MHLDENLLGKSLLATMNHQLVLLEDDSETKYKQKGLTVAPVDSTPLITLSARSPT